jgi:hypothetical protein
MHVGEFHLDYMVKCAHHFYFSLSTNDLMAHKYKLDKGLHDSLWYDVLPLFADETKSCKFLKLFLPDSCSQK